MTTLTSTNGVATSASATYKRHQYNDSRNQSDHEKYYHCFFDQQVPEGRCVGIQLIPVPSGHMHSFEHDQLLLQSTTSTSTATSDVDANHRHHQHHHWLYDFLHPEEIHYGLQLHHIHHRQSFYMGRLAIRHALQLPPPTPPFMTRANVPSNPSSVSRTEIIPHDRNDTVAMMRADHHTNNNNSNTTPLLIRNSILKDMYGRPQLPHGYLGSISHKGLMGVALVQRPPPDAFPSAQQQRPPHMGIGVDIEDISQAHRRRNVSAKVLTPQEIQNLGTLTYVYHHPNGNHSRTSTTTTTNDSTETAPLSSPQRPGQFLSVEEEILLRFSCKESVYKAIHPLVNQYVSFHEAEVQPYINGTATVTLKLAPSRANTTIAKQNEQFQTPIILYWYRYENYIITTARISRL